MKRIARHMRGHCIAYLALFVALGGTSVAAVQALPKNSITSKQIKNGTILKADLAKSTIAALHGARGAHGAAGAVGATGATGAAGAAGATGPAGPFPDALPSGKTVRGGWALAGTGTLDAGQTAISFIWPTSTAPTVHLVASGTTAPTGCSGTAAHPGASPGNLCVFQGWQTNSTVLQDYNGEDVTGPNDVSGFQGIVLYARGDAAGAFYQAGSYAVTAP
jgi:hypothetical protein